MSERAKHTPGPWRVGDGLFGKHTILVQGSTDTYTGTVWSVMAHVELLEATDGDGRHWYAPGSAEANAHLIAAAPDLLAMLERAEELLNYCGGWFRKFEDGSSQRAAYDTVLLNTRAALARARGETP